MKNIYDKLKGQWMLLGTGFALVFALGFAEFGQNIYSKTKFTFVIILFFLVGCSMDVCSVKLNRSSFKFAAVCQTLNLCILPISYYVLCHITGLDRIVLGPEISIGVIIALCMPMPSTIGVVLTEEAGGDIAIAILNASMGNILGPMISPILITLLGGIEFSEGLQTEILSLAGRILVPLLLGACLQRFIAQFDSVADRFRSVSGILLRCLLLFLFYMLFCEALISGTALLSIKLVVLTFIWIAVVHVVTFLIFWKITGMIGFQIPERIACTIMSSQKTEGKAFAIIAVLFPAGNDMVSLILPVVCYHSVQIILAAVAVPKFRQISLEDTTIPRHEPVSTEEVSLT